MLFTVSDRKGRFITSLSKEKFRVFDDNKAQVITHFSSETDLPLTVALLLDTSGSVRDKLGFEREAAVGFLKSTVRRGKDKALLVAFDTRTGFAPGLHRRHRRAGSICGKESRWRRNRSVRRGLFSGI